MEVKRGLYKKKRIFCDLRHLKCVDMEAYDESIVD